MGGKNQQELLLKIYRNCEGEESGYRRCRILKDTAQILGY